MKESTPGTFFRLGSNAAAAERTLGQARSGQWARRIWDKDASLWKKDDSAHRKIIGNALGWLSVARVMRARAPEIQSWAGEIRAEGFRHVVLCGMGGSSLAPEVFAETLSSKDWPRLIVLDSTSPEQIADVERTIDLARTFFLISSKSGSTLETNCHFRYFHEKVLAGSGGSREKAGRQFAAITDPGSSLAELAGRQALRRIFENFPDIGGRYSALSYFGVVPAALCGADISLLLARAIAAMESCSPSVPAGENPGLKLGTALGTLARAGVDKATIVCSPEIATFGTWLEQLVAESTGKEGKGIVPVESEETGFPSDYGKDRVFLYERVDQTADHSADAVLDRLLIAGHPVAAAALADRYDLPARMFVWEFAVAAAGAALGIDPFDQPNVQESKDNTAAVLSEFEKAGSLAPETVGLERGGLQFFGGTLESLLASSRPGRDYISIQAYAARNAQTEKILSAVRIRIRNATRCATTVGFGPRFLHSTGQLHKGGPDEGVFLQFVARPKIDRAIPGAKYSFGIFHQAQAIGDERALRSRGRRFLKVVFDGDSLDGLNRLSDSIFSALKGAR